MGRLFKNVHRDHFPRSTNRNIGKWCSRRHRQFSLLTLGKLFTIIFNILSHVHPVHHLLLTESFQILDGPLWKCYDCSAELSCDGLMEALKLIKHQILDWENTSHRQCHLLPGVVTRVADNTTMVIVFSLVEDVLIVVPYTIPL